MSGKRLGGRGVGVGVVTLSLVLETTRHYKRKRRGRLGVFGYYLGRFLGVVGRWEGWSGTRSTE